MTALGGGAFSYERGIPVTQVRGLSAPEFGDGPVDYERALRGRQAPHRSPPRQMRGVTAPPRTLQ